MNENPLIMGNQADTLEELRARVRHMAQWAEGDDENRALQQDLRMINGALSWLQNQADSTKI